MSESRPETTSYTEADRLEAQALLTIALQYVAHAEPEYAAVEIAKALCAARATGYNEGFAVVREQWLRERFAGWPPRECDHDAGECHDVAHQGGES